MIHLRWGAQGGRVGGVIVVELTGKRSAKVEVLDKHRV